LPAGSDQTKGIAFDQSYPWRHQWVRWFGPGPWAPPQVFFPWPAPVCVRLAPPSWFRCFCQIPHLRDWTMPEGL